eukprot:720439-Hanusia_phi.AAC.1
MGQNLVEIYITEEYKEKVKMVLDRALIGQETANFEFPLFTKDKQRVDVLLNATTRRDSSGLPVGVIGVGQDITERKRVEEEKTRVAQELQTFIDTANAPIFGIDADGKVNEWNQKAVEITGYTRSEVFGRDLVEVYITAEFRQSVRNVLQNALKGKEAANFEFPIFTKDNSRVELLLNATTRRDVSGAIIGVIGVGQDITDMRKLMEQEALLFQAQAANDAKSQFLATMSHEMRTPLNVIMGMSQMLLDTNLSIEQRRFAEQTMTSSESLLVLINDILDLTKIEAGKLELTSVEFDLRQVLEDAIDSIASKALEKGLEICLYLDPLLHTGVKGDPDRLRQILLNLLSNAIKFTHQGQVYLLVEPDDMTNALVTFRFKVYDSGIGISEEGQKKLFNRFSQVDSSTTRNYGGTGLGLAISKQFTELMNGSMGVSSSVGQGSLFWFTATFQRANDFQVKESKKYSRSIETEVVLVASNETLRYSMMKCIQGLDYKVKAVDRMSKVTFTTSNAKIVMIVCPSVANEQNRSIMKQQDIGNFENLETMYKSLREISAKYAGVSCLVLCPITQLRRSAEFRNIPRCVVLSRPSRLAPLGDALFEVSGEVFQNCILEDNSLSNRLTAAPEINFVSQDQEGTKILIAINDSSQRMVLKAMLMRESHECMACASTTELSHVIKQCGSGWNFDILFIDIDLQDAKSGDGETSFTIVEQIRKMEKDFPDRSKLVVVGIVDDINREESQNCLKAGFNVCLGRPLTRNDVNFILVEKKSHVRTGIVTNHWKVEHPESIATIHVDVPAVPLQQSHKTRVLVVDDDHGQRMLLKTMLRKAGYDVDEAEDGADALHAISRIEYDIVLMDGFMPKLTGWEATAQIRADEVARGASKQLTIIGITGAASSEDMAKFKAAGMSDVIAKPVKKDQLQDTVRKWTTRQELTSIPEIDQHSASMPKDVSSCILVYEPEKTQQVILKGFLKQTGVKFEIVDSFETCMSLSKLVKSYCVLYSIHDAAEAQVLLGRLKQKLVENHLTNIPIYGMADKAMLPSLDGLAFDQLIVKPVKKDALSKVLLAPCTTPVHCEDCHLSSAHEPTEGGRKEGQMRILIVEDHWANRRLLEAMLMKLGHRMEAVENGLEAVNITSNRRYDVILMDCNMPIMDGWQVTRRIWRREREGSGTWNVGGKRGEKWN